MFSRLYMEMKPKKLLYTRKSLAVFSKTYNSEILADFGGTVQYRHMYVRKEKILADFNLMVSWSIHQTAKFNSPSDFPAVLEMRS